MIKQHLANGREEIFQIVYVAFFP